MCSGLSHILFYGLQTKAKEAEEREKERISSLLKEARDRYPMLDKPVTSGFMSQAACLGLLGCG